MKPSPGSPEEAVAQEWLRQLRSGAITQISGHLRLVDWVDDDLLDDDENPLPGSNTVTGMCCLGVLCEVRNPAGWSSADDSIINFIETFDDVDGVSEVTFDEFPPANVIEGILTENEMRALAELNDAGATFLEIADVYESDSIPSCMVADAYKTWLAAWRGLASSRASQS